MTNNNINTTPNTEVKAPATATTPATIAATTTAPANTAATTPPATVPVSTTTAPSNMPPASGTATATPASAPATDSTAATLLKGYLSGGYFRGEGKCRYTDPALVEQAAVIGKALAASNTPPTAINKMVKTLKTAARLPYAAQQGALKKLTPQVLDLENKKKAPPLLREVVERNQQAVQNEADYAACLDHFKDIGIYLTAAKS